MLDQATLDEERIRLQLAANAGIAMPVAGAIAWAAISIASTQLSYGTWVFASCFGLGMLFPLAMLLQGITRSPFMKTKSPLNGVLAPGILVANLHWPITFALPNNAPELFPLAFGLSTAPIWAVVGWQYASKIGWLHLALRVPGVVALNAIAPDMQTAGTWITAYVAGVYVVSVIGFSIEVAGRRRKALGTTA
ncbi:hypothetical protein NHF45_04880 [Maricaulaceae bacterium NA33B04]|nr:hypothetical protein [Maricaulaceae bacterium NA33B04]